MPHAAANMKQMKALIYPPTAEKVRRIAAADKRSHNFTVNALLEQAIGTLAPVGKPVRVAAQRT